MFLERFKEVENFTITKLPLGGSKITFYDIIRIERYNFVQVVEKIRTPFLLKNIFYKMASTPRSQTFSERTSKN